MKIIDGLKLEGNPAEIPGATRDDLPGFFVEMGYTAGVEIGVDKGEFSEKLCQAGLTIYAIDPWLNYPEYFKRQRQDRLDETYEATKRRLAPYTCTIIRKTSMEAVKNFTDESLDFVYIDGNHEFKYVTEDIYEWSKKVKQGGVISGHDYTYSVPSHAYSCHVKHVLLAYTAAYHIHHWYVLGLRNEPGRDKWRSWMFIKP